jgi:hypothetical protein
MLFQDDRTIFNDDYFDELLYIITSYNNDTKIYRIYEHNDDYLHTQVEYFCSGSQITSEQYEKYINPLSLRYNGSLITGKMRDEDLIAQPLQGKHPQEDYACDITKKNGNRTSVHAQLVHIGYIRGIPNALYEYRRRQIIQRIMMLARSNLIDDVIKIIAQNVITLNNHSR